MTVIHGFEQPIPVVTPLGDGMALYVRSNGMLQDDEWCCCMLKGGDVKHFLSGQIKIFHNATYGIIKEVHE
jgi:hypothetical protein